MARVCIPALLSDLTGGCESVTVSGATVRQLIEELGRLHPGARERLCDGNELCAGLTVVVDGEVARFGLLQVVRPDSEVRFLPAGAGAAAKEPAPPRADSSSPAWVLTLVGLLHAALWLAAGVAVFVIVPHLMQFEENFALKLPYAAERLLLLALGFARFPPLFAALPLVDAIVLAALHRASSSRLLRIAWSVIVAGVILALLLWLAAAQGMMMVKLQESLLKRPVPLAPPAP